MLVIGLVGGIASGKSFVARRFAERGGIVLDADRVGHEVLEIPDVRSVLRERWGDSIFDAKGEVDRAAVARRVFSRPPDGPKQLRFLEELTHPRIHARLAEFIHKAECQGAAPALILDAPLLLEAGWDALCREIVFVDAPRQTRLLRAQASRGWSESQFAARERAQWPVERKRARATAIIDNSGDTALTDAQVDHFWEQVQQRVPWPPSISTSADTSHSGSA
jgi:dephospho-CoA kinase